MNILKRFTQIGKIYRLKNVFQRTKRRKIFASVFFFLLYLIVFQNVFPEDIFWFNNVNVSCYYSNSNDSLSSIEQFSPSSRSIFFHETSCKGFLSSRQSCSVESAARAHPNRQIYVLFSGPVTRDALNLDSSLMLKTYRNINFVRLHINDYVQRTPLEESLIVSVMSRWKGFPHVLRYLTLYKFGGIYIDFDIIVARSLDSLARNWAARVSDIEVSSDILAISKDDVGTKVANMIIR